jgi:hypothetical protein
VAARANGLGEMSDGRSRPGADGPRSVLAVDCVGGDTQRDLPLARADAEREGLLE